MQDNAFSQTAFRMTGELNERIIFLIIWPSKSLDLNSKENIWNLMKNFTQLKYPDLVKEKLRTQSQLWDGLQEALDFIAVDELKNLISCILARSWAVVVEDVGLIKY